MVGYEDYPQILEVEREDSSQTGILGSHDNKNIMPCAKGHN